MRTRMLIACVLALLIASASLCAAAEKSDLMWWKAAPGQKPTVKGAVTNVSPTNIAVRTKQGVKAFTVSDKTKVFIQGEKATIAGVAVGDQVVVRFKLQGNNVPLAIAIRVPKPAVSGRIVSIDGNIIVVSECREPVRAKAGRRANAARPRAPQSDATATVERRIAVSDQTKYRSHGYVGSIADLRVGYGITARGAASGDTLQADAIQFVPGVAKGAVVSIENGTITAKTVRQLTIALEPSDATAVLVRPRVGPNQKGTLADVKVGSPVNIGFHPNQAGASPLLWIDVLTGA